MGKGSFISARDYEPFLELMRVQTGCEWRTTPEIKRDVPSWAIGLGLIGLLGGAFLGGAFLGLGGAIGLGVLYGALGRSGEHTSELQSQSNIVCRLLLD